MFLTALSFEDAWSRGDAQQVLRLLADDADVTVAPPFVAHVDDGAGLPRDAVAHRLIGGATVDGTRALTVADGSRGRCKSATPTAGFRRGPLRAAVPDGRITDRGLIPVH